MRDAAGVLLAAAEAMVAMLKREDSLRKHEATPTWPLRRAGAVAGPALRGVELKRDPFESMCYRPAKRSQRSGLGRGALNELCR
jgi:hypothetical protein